MEIWIYPVLAADAAAIMACLYFSYECRKEQEFRAAKNGVLISCFLFLLGFSLFIPIAGAFAAFIFAILFIFGLSLLIPAVPNPKALMGTNGYRSAEPVRFDERDSVFARYRSLEPGSDLYQTYYSALHPEREEKDARRRQKGFIGKPGIIDKEYPPNVAMMHAAFDIPPFLGHYATNPPDPVAVKIPLPPEKASEIVKNFTLHLGADRVGICKINPDLIYSNRGETHYDRKEDWGKEIKDLPPYAVVFLTEMSHGHVISAPHTPTVAESAHLYARGAYIGTLLARWFAHMGYTGVAEHTRNYSVILPPLAADAGLGEVGRQGYLIAPGMGARCRVFAVLTDMPLALDRPIALGVEEFCQSCKKCADSCPSKSIPHGEKTVCNGFSKWKLDEDACFDFWSRVGTDCSVCMAICPFSRPDTLLHRGVRTLVAKSKTAQVLFPHFDNLLYGKKWRPKPVAPWLNYRKELDKNEWY